MKVLYTGSFNPFHNGHQYVYDLTCKMFGKENVWIGVGQNSDKKEVSAENICFSIRPISKNVFSYSSLTADVVKEQKFDLLVRGVRPSFSLEQEHQLCHWNKELCGVDTILIPTPPEFNMISSGAIRELVKHGKDVTPYMNKYVYLRWINKKPLIQVYFGKCCCGKTTYLKGHAVNVIELDKVWKRLVDYRFGDLEYQTAVMKKLFYDKSYYFISYVQNMAICLDGEKFFNYLIPADSVFDMPVIGRYLDCIPDDIVGRLELVKVTTSEENRKNFALARNVDPRLIECNDHFYIDPPFWDGDVEIVSGEL
jgi:pantetheine-phosphate adenylyltransferase